MNRSDAKLIRAGRLILGLSQADLAHNLGVDVNDVDVLETMPEEASADLWKKALRILTNRGIADRRLLRAGRGLLEQTQNEIAKHAEIAAGTYRRCENEGLDFDGVVKTSRTLAKLLSYMESKGILITFSEKTGAGVSLKGHLVNHNLPGIKIIEPPTPKTRLTPH